MSNHWGGVAQGVICDMCDIQSPNPQIAQLLLCKAFHLGEDVPRMVKIFTKTKRTYVFQAREGAAAKGAAIKYNIFLSPWSSS